MIADLISPNSTRNQFRLKRIRLLNEIIGTVLREKEHCRILDIGGTGAFWATWTDHIDWQRVSVTCANLDPAAGSVAAAPVEVIHGDARDLSSIKNGSYDIVFSNSVIEHVGMWRDMEAMASEVHRLAQYHLVQTPYFWFPIEPHARTPILHWLPESLAYRVVMLFKCGFWTKAATVNQAVRTVQSARLLDRRQFAALFPNSEVRSERFLGLTKSLVAIRCAD